MTVDDLVTFTELVINRARSYKNILIKSTVALFWLAIQYFLANKSAPNQQSVNECGKLLFIIKACSDYSDAAVTSD